MMGSRLIFKRLIVLALVTVLSSSCGYNRLVSHQEEVNKSWSVLENYYQQRADRAALLLKLYAVSGLDKKDITGELNAAMDSVRRLSLQMDPDNLGQSYVSTWEEAQLNLATRINKAIADIQKSGYDRINMEYRDLQKELKAMDQKINQAVMQYNEAALKYNSSRQRVNNMAMAALARFKPKGYFQKTADSK
jgi:LemA protein